MNKQFTLYGSVVILLLLILTEANAQVNPLISSYFQNRYLNNPAIAGSGKGINVHAVYNRDLANSNVAPTINMLSVDYRFKNMGFGLNVNAAKDGNFNNNKYLASYAYHLQFSDERQVSFGLSAGVTTDKFRMGDIYGDADDPSVMNYNDRELDFDADFGVAYSATNGLNFEGVVQNVRQYFNEYAEVALYPSAMFFTALSYKVSTPMVAFEPKVVYRGFWNRSNIFDLGLNAVFAGEKINIMGAYHSTKNATFGLGFTYQKQYQLQLGYRTQSISKTTDYSSGAFEVGFRAIFLNH